MKCIFKKSRKEAVSILVLIASFAFNVHADQPVKKNSAYEWTREKINSLKASICKHPWRYASGAVITTAAIGLGAYAYKNRIRVAVPLLPIVPAAAQAALSQSPKPFLLDLKRAVEGDLFAMENAIRLQQYGRIDLRTFEQITNTNHVAKLHSELNPIRNIFIEISGFVGTPPANLADLALLNNHLIALRNQVKEYLPKYN